MRVEGLSGQGGLEHIAVIISGQERGRTIERKKERERVKRTETDKKEEKENKRK